MEHIIRVKARKVSAVNPVFVADSDNTDTLTVELDDEWNDCDSVLTLGSGSSSQDIDIDGEPIEVPADILVPGWLPVYIEGTTPDGGTVSTMKCDRLLKVLESGRPKAGGE